jgi:Fe-S-cluster containining protein
MRTVDGMPFECKQCGACCRWQGKVYLTPDDVSKLSEHFGVGMEGFVDGYTEPYGSDMVLKNKPGSQDCILMDGNRCGVWGHHPSQCEEWPKRYDAKCPGFNNVGEGRMDYKEAVERVNKKFSALQEWDRSVSDQFYRGLAEGTEAKLASQALTSGVDPYENMNRVKVASMDDLFAFHRASDNHLIHKATRDLWSIEQDKDGGVMITRLFDNDGEPIKG